MELSTFQRPGMSREFNVVYHRDLRVRASKIYSESIWVNLPENGDRIYVAWDGNWHQYLKPLKKDVPHFRIIKVGKDYTALKPLNEKAREVDIWRTSMWWTKKQNFLIIPGEGKPMSWDKAQRLGKTLEAKSPKVI